MDSEALGRYLGARLGTDVRVVEATLAPIGMSRETWFLALETPAGTQRLVLRRDVATGGSACPVPLRFEYEMHRRLAGTAVPIAPARWYEDDPAKALDGREFYLREYVDGSPAIPDFANPDPAYDPLRIAISQEHARKMATVHTVDWRKLGLDALMPAPPSPETCARTAVDRIEATLAEFRFEAYPALTETLRWLREHAPSTAPRVALLKGSNGANQEILRAGTIVGMSDWELASLGDPASDWARCSGFVPEIAGKWGEQQLLEYYESISGIHVDPANVAYYRTLYRAEMVVVCHHAALPLRRGIPLLPGLAYLATIGLLGSLRGGTEAAGITTSPAAFRSVPAAGDGPASS